MPHADPEARRDYLRKWKAEHAEHVRVERKRYRAANLETMAAKDRARYLASRGREADDATDYRYKIDDAAGGEILSRYAAGESCPKLAEDYGVTGFGIQQFLHRKGVKLRGVGESNRSYLLNESAFDSVTEESAYWVGFLLTDGCVHGDAIMLNLSVRDAGHVEKFARFLGSNEPARIYQPGLSAKGGPMARFGVKSARLAAALAAFGVVPRKTFIAAAPAALVGNRHFWRGVIDGDGSACMTRGAKRYPLLSLCGASPPLIEQFAAYCSNLLGGKLVSARHALERLWRASVSGTFAVRVIRELYSDATVSLDRKAANAAEAMARTFRTNGGTRSYSQE